ncbi:MAG: addiction module protein [Deltaproteobacteria bacterium]|nr:addiction module protein [Deltaproteobacteria bacterium]
MTTRDKIRAMEQIWDDLQRTAEAVPSPAWHADVLKARKRRAHRAVARFSEWQDAKKRIRERAR